MYVCECAYKHLCIVSCWLQAGVYLAVSLHACVRVYSYVCVAHVQALVDRNVYLCVLCVSRLYFQIVLKFEIAGHCGHP